MPIPVLLKRELRLLSLRPALLFGVSHNDSRPAQEAAPKKTLNAESIGLPAGQRSPALSAVDQFGHQQTNDTLKGIERNDSAVFSLGRLVTVLQSAARAAAKRKTKI